MLSVAVLKYGSGPKQLFNMGWNELFEIKRFHVIFGTNFSRLLLKKIWDYRSFIFRILLTFVSILELFFFPKLSNTWDCVKATFVTWFGAAMPHFADYSWYCNLLVNVYSLRGNNFRQKPTRRKSNFKHRFFVHVEWNFPVR